MVIAYEGDVLYLAGTGGGEDAFYACDVAGVQRNGEWIKRPEAYGGEHPVDED